MKKINCILLIDDDEISNFINETLLKRMGVASEIKVVKNGIDGLKYITIYDEKGICPELILLDLNMPVIDGYEFLESFDKLIFENKNNVKIVVLSSSNNPRDEERLKNEFGISNYFIKPLTEEKVLSILNLKPATSSN
ncbi:response regulator [Sporocytophaga myxococcoides]|uniref:response regulator n=1 Tax=Sporocytophaga myxococcoides TaxID=153721 RepID=UPI000421C92C|nr:response regulator [Sporocytophaga myxococcoides]